MARIPAIQNPWVFFIDVLELITFPLSFGYVLYPPLLFFLAPAPITVPQFFSFFSF